MSETDLFSAAGISLAETPAMKPKRAPKPIPPTPAALAAVGRLEGARRFRAPPRGRVGPGRQLGAGEVVSFPLSRNSKLLAQMVKKLPHGFSDELEKRRGEEARKLEKRLTYKGIGKLSARLCARELLHRAYMERVKQAEKEM